MQIACSSCGTRYALDTRAWTCPNCGGLFEIADPVRFDPAQIDTANASLWRYRAFLPLPSNASPISLGEGYTPIVETRLDGLTCLSKLDFMMPTGSFKDRGSTVLVSVLHALGVSRVIDDSSGNAAASLSAYAAHAGLTADIFVPAHASPAKLSQIQMYGAQLHPIPGPRANAARAAEQAATEGDAYYASHNRSPFVLAGMMTTAWEIWEQLGRRAPAAVIAPVGHGTNLTGLARGFQVLQRAGLIDQMPRLHAAQAAAVAPLARAFEQGMASVTAVEPAQTIAEGIAINMPVRGKELLAAIKQTHGSVISVGEEEIIEARNGVARVGLYVEPTSATAFAALRRMDASGHINGTVVVTCTGSGLKAPVPVS